MIDSRTQRLRATDGGSRSVAITAGGEGWVNRDKRLAAMNRKDIKRWWGHVELYSPRAAWAIKENRDYPRRILLQRQPSYLVWGLGVTCEVINGMAISTS